MSLRKLHSIIVVALAVACLPAVAPVYGENELPQQFPKDIPYELGASGFAAGDKITITSVHGDRAHIDTGGSYLVEGTYTLTSVENANLALHCTTRGPSGPTPIQSGQQIKITKGTGSFRLYETNLADGWLHVSFYVEGEGHSHGGVYLGEKGRENTIMRRKEWFREYTDKSGDDMTGASIDMTNPANRALMRYLGNPVPPPAGMDAKYGKENLLKAFTELCRKADLTIAKTAVDDSEFPFLVYGIIDGRHSLPERPAFEEIKGYTYGGSVRGSHGKGMTYFAVNMVPQSQYPKEQSEACERRLMVRLQVLAEKAWHDE